MALTRSVLTQAVVWLIVGIIGGGIAGNWWERHRTATDVADLKVRQADQLREIQAKVDELTRDLDAERQRRQALEGVLADLRKGS
jgi:outer membrane murein-binding lipoprotein Lpp